MKTHAADLLILDMIMDPGIDGLETRSGSRYMRPDSRPMDHGRLHVLSCYRYSFRFVVCISVLSLFDCMDSFPRLSF